MTRSLIVLWSINIATIVCTFLLLFFASGWWFLLPPLVWLFALAGLLFLLDKM
jgi:hypothetical protein